jgi:hypothetical protein
MISEYKMTYFMKTFDAILFAIGIILMLLLSAHSKEENVIHKVLAFSMCPILFSDIIIPPIISEPIAPMPVESFMTPKHIDFHVHIPEEIHELPNA